MSVGSCNYLHIKNLDVVFFSNAKNSSVTFAHEDNGWGIYYWWKNNWNRLYKVLHSSKKGKHFPSSVLCCGVSNFHFEQVNTGWVDWRKDLSFKIWLLVIIFLININIDRHLETKIPFFLEVFAECTYLHYKKSGKQPSSDLILWSLMRNTQVILKVLTFARHSVKLPRIFSFQCI